MNSKKVENLAYEALVHLCNQTEQVDFAQVRLNDKTISWDGELILFNSKESFCNGKKDGLEKRIPIQLKGYTDKISDITPTTSFDIDMKDLKNYETNNGCLFLLVTIKSNNLVTYYNILSRKKLQSLISLQKQCRIQLNIINDPKHFLQILTSAYLTFNNRISSSTAKITFKNLSPGQIIPLAPSVINDNGSSILKLQLKDIDIEVSKE